MTDELRKLILKEWQVKNPEASLIEVVPSDYALIGKAHTVQETKVLTDKVLKQLGINKKSKL